MSKAAGALECWAKKSRIFLYFATLRLRSASLRSELEKQIFNFRCEVPEHLAPFIRVTSWLHEEGTAIEIFPERDPRGKYTLLQSGDLLVHHTSTYDTYKKYVCKTEHLLSGMRRRSLVPARLTLKGKRFQDTKSYGGSLNCTGKLPSSRSPMQMDLFFL